MTGSNGVSLSESKAKVFTSPVKPGQDKKLYRAIELPNGMKALLISDQRHDFAILDAQEELLTVTGDTEDVSDEEGDEDMEDSDERESDGEADCSEETSKKDEKSLLKKSAASMCIRVGCFSDPPELEGLAHFLEHMVFMGSAKYPDENGFDKLMSKNGGSSNASTDCERTKFYFEVQRKSFRESLEHFAQFFISPLLKLDAMQREREAVDSEFQMSLQCDYSRISQLIGKLSKEEHPMGKFLWGNIESLLPSNLDDMEINKKLAEFKDRHYSSSSMTLAVQSQHDLDTLQEWVETCFSDVPNSNQEFEKFSHLTDPFDTRAFKSIIKVVPVEDVHGLTLTWPLPPMEDKYLVKPLSYLGWVIGHEGHGSLISYLRKKVLALTLAAGSDDDFSSNSSCSLFTIEIVLSESGRCRVEEVIEAVFSYLKMLKGHGPSERIFKEIQKLGELEFEFGEEKQPQEMVEEICESMHLYPPELWLSGPNLTFEYDPNLLSDCINSLNENNVNIVLTAKEFKDICTKTEKWFKTQYCDDEITQELRERWQNVPIFPDFTLPAPNSYIAEDVSLKIKSDIEMQYPIAVLKDLDGELFFKKDDIFQLPRAIVTIHLHADMAYSSAVNAVCMDLLVACWKLKMAEELYTAEIALLKSNLFSAEKGLSLEVSGLNDKICNLVETLLESIKNFEDSVTDEMFDALRGQLKKDYYNGFIKPEKQGRHLRLQILQNTFHSHLHRHAVVGTITKEQVFQFSREFMNSGLFMKCLVQGNLTRQEAESIYLKARAVLNLKGDKSVKVGHICPNAIPVGSHYLKVHNLNETDSNTVVINYYQDGEASLKTFALLKVAMAIMAEPAFDRLRTQEQLGYDVSADMKDTYGAIGVTIFVNSQETKYTSEHVDGRIEAFVDWLIEEKLEKMTDEEFNLIVSSSIKSLKSADVTLEEEVNRNWAEILKGDYLFDRQSRLADLMESCSKSSVVSYLKKLLKSSDSRRKLSLQVVGSAESLGSPKRSEALLSDANDNKVYDLKYIQNIDRATPYMITNVDDFKASLVSFPEIHVIK